MAEFDFFLAFDRIATEISFCIRRKILKNIPIGITDFEEIIENNFYYVDKTVLIKSVLSEGAKAILIPRPRRFGKTLNMSMLQYFFEKREESKAYLFENLAISKFPECMHYQGYYPVIALSFKDIKHTEWQDCKNSLLGLIVQEFRRHIYLLDSALLLASEKKEFNDVLARSATSDLYESALKSLSSYLHRYHGVKPIILIDEYDTPIHSGYINGYYDKIIMFMRNFLSAGLKDNNNLEFALMTGILRIAKESIFSGLNNLYVCSLIDELNSTMFGFTEPEVAEILEYYTLDSKRQDVARWYDGYNMGGTKMYNPWSINNYIASGGVFENYWVNVSSNDIIKDLFIHADETIKEDLEALITGQTITKDIKSTIVFQELEDQTDIIWSFLLFSGYLTYRNLVFGGDNPVADIYIPNKEVSSLYKNIISLWFKRGTYKKKYPHMLQCLVTGNIDEFTELFYEFVANTFSQFDVSGNEPERFYHAFVLGMMVGIEKEYEVKSNRESGLGRYDVMLIPFDTSKNGVVIEFKKVSSYAQETLEIAVDKALKQIEAKNYVQELHARGIKNVIKLAIAFERKRVLVRQAT